MFKRFPFIHNHGDFVHLDALREWFKGVPSLDAFLKYKNDKAIVKDLHFTDEKTTVEYIDTTDDTKKEATLCEYLTSNIYDEENLNEFIRADKINFRKDSNGENWIDLREKPLKKERIGVIRSNVPPVYSATDDYTAGKKYVHFGFSDNSVKFYDDKTLKQIKEIPFGSDVSVTWQTLPNCNPFSGAFNQTTSESLTIEKSGVFYGTVVTISGKRPIVIGGQVMYSINSDLHLEAGKSATLMFTPGDMDLQNNYFHNNVYPKNVECLTEGGVIATLSKHMSYPHTNDDPTYVTLLNTTDKEIVIHGIHFTF